MSVGARPARSAHEVVEMLASAARTATGQGSAIRLPNAPAYAFILDLTAAASAVDDTLDVYIQTKLDGTNWTDVAHFTQILGNGADALRYVSKIAPAAQAQAEFSVATALAAAGVRHLAGDEWRVSWVVVNGAGTHSFTFSVTAIPQP